MTTEFLWLTARAASALCDHVAHIVRASAGKQVRGIYASRIVASMQDVESIGHWAVRHLKGNAMGEALSVAPVYLKLKEAVPLIVAGREPFPAFRRVFDRHLFPKSLVYASHHGETYHYPLSNQRES
jgi:hypothetical protein